MRLHRIGAYRDGASAELFDHVVRVAAADAAFAATLQERLLRENAQQRDELQHAKERAEAASQAKSRFLATMSHEIRTPMNVVTGLASVLAKSPLNDEQKKIVDTLKAQKRTEV